jgi:hypothetical protein
MTRTFAWATAALIVAALASPVAATPKPMTRAAIMELAKPVVGFSYWWGHGRYTTASVPVGSCSGGCPSCTHSGAYGGDCSGFVGKAWQIPSPISIDVDAHPYGTIHFYNDKTWWNRIPWSDAKAADAFTYNSGTAGHIFLYESGDPWGHVWAYECKGCSAGCQHDLRSVTSAYVAIRRVLIDETSPDGGAGAGGSPSGAGDGGGEIAGAGGASEVIVGSAGAGGSGPRAEGDIGEGGNDNATVSAGPDAAPAGAPSSDKGPALNGVSNVEGGCGCRVATPRRNQVGWLAVLLPWMARRRRRRIARA